MTGIKRTLFVFVSFWKMRKPLLLKVREMKCFKRLFYTYKLGKLIPWCFNFNCVLFTFSCSRIPVGVPLWYISVNPLGSSAKLYWGLTQMMHLLHVSSHWFVADEHFPSFNSKSHSVIKITNQRTHRCPLNRFVIKFTASYSKSFTGRRRRGECVQ